MGLEKAIERGKEKRKPYRDSRRFDYSCRNHGDCPWCEGNRMRKKFRMSEAARAEIEFVFSPQDERWCEVLAYEED